MWVLCMEPVYGIEAGVAKLAMDCSMVEAETAEGDLLIWPGNASAWIPRSRAWKFLASLSQAT